MARIRSIKPEFWSSETLATVSRDARLLFIGLWNYCDDYGCTLDIPRRILGDVFPHDDDVTEGNIKEWIEELVGAGVLLRCRMESRGALIVKTWKEHQRVDKAGKVRVVPEATLRETLAKHSRNTREDSSKGSRLDLGSRNKELVSRKRDQIPPISPAINAVGESVSSSDNLNAFVGGLIVPCEPFLRYFANHDKKTHYKRAAIAWNEAITSGHEAETIIASYATAPRVVQASEIKHIPNPEAYLTEEAFLDPPVPPKGAPSDLLIGFEVEE